VTSLSENTVAREAYYSRAVDHLGIIGAKLRDLSGFATLAYELTQNAEDAKARTLAFRIGDDALVVENDGVFSDCGQISAPECPWRSDDRYSHRCDFHRLRLVAAADKRDQEGTVGAFGIGFLAVYQVTDVPSVISAGRHWIIDETQEESQRIRECRGCLSCRAAELPGTRFVLPWAFSASNMRVRLRAEPLAPAELSLLEHELLNALPGTLLFLRHVEAVEVWRNDLRIQHLQRVADEATLILSDGVHDRLWHVVKGEFAADAAALRARHAKTIELKKTDRVAVAIPADLSVPGVMCAYLPTQHAIGLPFHIQADFYPTSDRKRVILDSGFQAEWNVAAIRAAAWAISRSLEHLRDSLGPERLWELVECARTVAVEATKGQREPCLSEFWSSLHPEVRRSPVVWTSAGAWCLPSEVLLLEKGEEEASVELFEALELKVLHPSLRPYFALLRTSEIGARLMEIPDLVRAVMAKTGPGPVPTEERPNLLRSPSAIACLWHEIEVLLQRPRRTDEREKDLRLLRECPIVPCRDGTLRSGNETYWADADTIAVFDVFEGAIPFADPDAAEHALFRRHCLEFNAEAAVDELSKILGGESTSPMHSDVANRILGWFEKHREKIVGTPRLAVALASLPLFPTATGFRPLTELSLPGDFVDPLGLSEVVDVAHVSGRRDFLRALGARELTVAQYAAAHLPRAFENAHLSLEKRRQAVRLLADRLGEVRDDPAARVALAATTIAECEDGIFRRPFATYLPLPGVRRILADSVAYAVVPSEHSAAVEELLRWLGVADQPRPEDVVDRIRAVTSVPLTPQSVGFVSEAVVYLTQLWKGGGLSDRLAQRLRDIAWLPAKDSPEWHRPSKVYAAFQEYLFATQALFLDIPLQVQRTANDVLHALGVQTTPTPPLVVSHLLTCVRTGAPVNREVYAYLNDAVEDPGSRLALSRLRGTACLLVPDGHFVSPTQVFWNEHSFGRWRLSLGGEFRRYQSLLEFLGVREGPTAEDALAVLLEIADEYGPGNRVLDDEAHGVVLLCWRMLSVALDEETIESSRLRALAECKVIPGVQRTLNPPTWMFFEDRAGFGLRFPRLKYNLLSRPEGAWRAMATAGVRSIARAAESELLECVDPVDDTVLLERIGARRSEMYRVLDATAPGGGMRAELDELLEDLRCVHVSELLVRFKILLFGREEVSEPDRVSAHFQRDEKTLYFSGSGRPWPSIARELGLALDPDADGVGVLASGFRDILAPDSAEVARHMLDELGFPRIEEADDRGVHGSHIADFGGQTESRFDRDSEGLELTPQTEPSYTPERAAIEPPVPAVPGTDGRSESAGAAVTNGIARARDTSALGSQGNSGRFTDNLVDGDVQRTAPSRRHTQGKLRTYVVSGDAGLSSNNSETVNEQRTALDIAGIACVLQYERQAGRHPLEMPHSNPGYDIESYDGGGSVARYIEVKSCGDDWGERGVALSDAQFERAQELGERYWLYVVGRAASDSTAIYRIQNPAQRVNQFVYDSGWQTLVE
jgi:hypothetical protein